MTAARMMSKQSVFCGVDHGLKRIGLAVANPEGTIACPLGTVAADGPWETVMDRVVEAVRDHDVGEWVVGLPLNMDGTEGGQAKLARRFGRRLGRVTAAPVHYWDERLSSSAADEYLAMAGLTRKKKKARRDAVAAQVILQSFLDARR